MDQYCDLIAVNSSISEQSNAKLAATDLPGSLAHMTHFNFMFALRFYQFMHNLRSMRDVDFKDSSMSFVATLDKARSRFQQR
jgi:hypothetical protein